MAALMAPRAPADGEAADREADAERLRRRCRSRVAAEDGGADALSLINTLRAMAIDPRLGSAVARRGQRRPVRAGGAAGRARADRAGGRRDGSCRWSGWAASRTGRRRARLHRRGRDVRRRRHGELSRSGGRRRECATSSRASLQRRSRRRRCTTHAQRHAACGARPETAAKCSAKSSVLNARLSRVAASRDAFAFICDSFFQGGGCTPRGRAYNRRPCPPPPSLPPPPRSVR